MPFRRIPSWILTSEMTPRYLSYRESNRKAFSGACVLPFGGGTRLIIASKIDSTLFPVFADIDIISEGSTSKVDCIWAAIRSGWAAGRSILLRTGMMVSPLSRALWNTDIDCA